MRALFVSPLYPPNRSGSAVHMASLAQGLAADGVDVRAWTTEARDTHFLVDRSLRHVSRRRECLHGVQIRRFGLSRWAIRHPEAFRRLHMLKPPWSIWAFRDRATHAPGLLANALASPTRFDLVVAGVLPHTPFVVAGLAVARRWKAPLVVLSLIHAGEPGRVEYRQEFLGHGVPMLLRHADLVVCNTDVERRLLEARGLNGRRLVTIGPGAHPADCIGGNARRFRERFNLRGAIVLQLGTQTHEKGSHHSAEAVCALRARGHDVSGVFIGYPRSDFEEGYLSSRSADQLAGLLVLGEVDDDLKRDALAAADVVVLPSRADSFGIAILEAWMASKPVIGCLAGGIPEVIQDGVDGFLVPFGDWHAIAELVELLLDRPDVARALGEAGRAKVWSRYTWDHVVNRFREAVYPLLGRAPLL
ncbi:glycosyltransferase family 4 protein [Candidatus Fermentibacteria bacterium]|nr:glycosyltransferase family 4 protein [Candidatus Fermentibacteria bacterium]